MELKDSACVCQRLVSQTLADWPGTITYIDDILIFGSTRAEHDTSLLMPLQRLSDKDFCLQLAKCEFAVPKITFLGHLTSSNGIQPDPKNVQPILDAPTLNTVKQTEFFRYGELTIIHGSSKTWQQQLSPSVG
ncbi:Gag-Pol polyprotein [Plakobranchus ocellatus]|uniref:Gag-Pol polyprotein n=1 Tax=Plakobranchus ocellatus TaxID=259542 RepID=A0AAV3ZCQ5_9GAST|nr:Gag-Pol polyprotein [Plakobranchus ocellatus]